MTTTRAGGELIKSDFIIKSSNPDWLLYEIIGKVIFEGSVRGRRPTINLKTFPGH